MAKLFSTRLEKRVISYVCSDNPEAVRLFAKLDESFFKREASKAAFRRIRTLVKKNNEFPEYSDLIEDPALDEQVRADLKQFNEELERTKTRSNALFDKLDEYRKLRLAFDTAAKVVDALKAQSVNSDELFGHLATALEESRNASGISMVHLGGDNDDVLKLVKKNLKGSSATYIPTGIKAFDKVNRGIARGSLFTLGADSGGGKSTVAQQIGRNMADAGYKVGLWALEMSKDEMIQRDISARAGIEMTKVINPALMTLEEKKRAYRVMKETHERYRKTGGMFTTVSPSTDVSIEEALFSLKPYGYDVIIIDYITLLKDSGGENQWQRLGDIARVAKVFAANNDLVVILLVQVNQEGIIKYSKTIREHSNNMWVWVRDQRARDSNILFIQQQKARNQSDLPFEVHENFAFMRVTDVPDDYVPPTESEKPADKGPIVVRNGKTNKAPPEKKRFRL